MKDLLKGKDQWNIPELLHAIVILSYYHSWACFIFANGIKLEYDMGYFCKEKGKYVKRASLDEKVQNFPLITFDSSTY